MPRVQIQKLRWVPVKIAVGKVAKGLDTELRACADAYGLTNLRSAKAGETTKPRNAPAGAAQLQQHQFAGGWGGQLWTDSTGRILDAASCSVAPGISSKVAAPIGLATANTNPNLALSRFTSVEAKTTGKA